MERDPAKGSWVDGSQAPPKPTSTLDLGSEVEVTRTAIKESSAPPPRPSGKSRTLADDPLNAELNESMMADPGSRGGAFAEVQRDARECDEDGGPCEGLSAEDVLRELRKLEDVDESRKLSIFTCYNVRLFYIDPEGEVSSNFENNKLVIFKVEGEITETIFLQVGPWVYPLFTAVSPCYRSEDGIYIFPDIYAETERATVGLILPKEEYTALHEVLTELLETKAAARARRSAVGETAVYLSDNLNNGSSYLSRNMIRASMNLAGYLDSATSNILTKIQPREEAAISPNVGKVAQAAEKMSSNALTVSNYLSSNLAQAVAAMGRYITPYVPNAVKSAVPEEAASFTVNTLRGIGNVYNGLEESAGILARSVSNNAVKLVGHRYGQSAGHLTRDVLSTVGNIYAARRNVNFLRPKSLARATLRSAGQAFLEDRRSHV